MSAIGAPQQHKQSSRKGKKAWRKNVDVTDVQDGLEVYQEEVRAGGPLREKNADELFALDTVGSKDIVKKYNLGKPLKVDEILAKRSAVPIVENRKRAGVELGSGVYEPASKRRKGDWVTKKEVQRLKRTINTTSHIGDDVSGDQAGPFDLWDAQPVVTVADKLEYIPKVRAKVAPTTLALQPTAMTANGKPVKPVPNPKAGSSYNPDYDEWNEAVIREGDREVEAEKLRLKAEQAEAERLARIEAATEDDQVYRTEDESAWEGFETENEDVEALKKKRPARKTPAERNKIKRRKEAERLAKHEKKMVDKKDVGEQIARMMISGQLTTVDGENALEALQTLSDDDSESGDDTKLRRRKLGNAMVPAKNLEIVLPEELQDSLRRLKPEGNLLQDRFRNLLVNGKLESRKPIVQAKKRKVKMTEKWAYKDFSIQV